MWTKQQIDRFQLIENQLKSYSVNLNKGVQVKKPFISEEERKLFGDYKGTNISDLILDALN